MCEQSYRDSGRRCGRSFVENLMQGLTHGLAHAAEAECLSRKPALIQGLDPRCKLVVCLLLILTGVLTHSLARLGVVVASSSTLALCAGIGLRRLATRVWLAVFLFTGLIALPSLFIVPGRTIGQLPLTGWTVSEQGLRAGLFLLGRAQNSTTACLLLIVSTPWSHVLKALRCLGVPSMVVALLGMTHRYVFLLLQTALEFFEARRSRLIGRLSRARQRQMIAQSAGVLLEKSVQLSTEVHLAMISRGYRGEIHLMDDFRLRRRDVVALLLTLALFIAIAGGGR